MKAIKHLALSEIATVKSGLALRSAAPIREGGAVQILQPGALTGERYIKHEDLPWCGIESVPRRVLLAPGDIIFQSRGQPKCSVFRGDADCTILVAPLFRIRPLGSEVRSEFLALQMASVTARGELQRAARGSAARFISRRDIEALAVSIPTIERQDRILEISDLADREAALNARLARLRTATINALLADRSVTPVVTSIN